MQRNGGYGRAPEFAARQALRKKLLRGDIGDLTVKSHFARFKLFTAFMKQRFSIRDMIDVAPKHVIEYAKNLDAAYSAAYAQNLISSVNVVLVLLTHGKWQSLSPAQLTGRRRTNCRTRPVMVLPPGAVARMLRGRVPEAQLDHLNMIDFFGLRAREGALIDVPAALREIEIDVQIDVRRGTKGGRGWSVTRAIPASFEAQNFLRQVNERIEGAFTIIPDGCSRDQFLRSSSRILLPALKNVGLSTLREIRSIVAARWYIELTGCPPPCNINLDSDRLASYETDRAARKIIARRLGHNRIEIMNSYVGAYGRTRHA
ncbi:hypothetical protein [Microbulbifer elongatus]|uniref:hypothetical protein n=1 Tax=Microbulbifer elongatus TaxID=86173 RepID=UPI001CFDE4A5|nr:hypothetical protein [Microbulbifer elongatus]